MLLKAVANPKQSNIHNEVVIPLELSLEPHPDLISFTERRVPFFNHEVVPNLLRTKLDPTIEDKDLKIEAEAFRKFQTVGDLQKAVDEMLARCKKHKTKIDNNEKASNNNSSNDLSHSKHQIKTSNPETRNTLIGMYRHGLGIPNSAATEKVERIQASSQPVTITKQKTSRKRQSTTVKTNIINQ